MHGRSQPLRAERLDDLAGFLDSSPQHRQQCGLWRSLPGIEFAVTISRVGRAADTRDDPLANITGQMQQEISDGIFRLMPAQPDLVFGQARKAFVEAVHVLFESTS